MTDFTACSHPLLAVPCPTCRAGAGTWCNRLSGHRAAAFHQHRCIEADRLFIDQHGETASIDRDGDGWRIDPQGRKRD